MSDLGHPTVDGLAAGKKAVRMIGKDPRICIDHSSARADKYASGEAGGV